MTTALKVHGADLSHHNPDPDLKKAKAAGLQFLYHKATEGATVKDPKYAARRKAAKAAGVPFGAYHFARPDGGDAVKEAQFFFATAKPVAGDLAPCLDFEVKYANAEAWCKKFMTELERLMKGAKLVGRPVHYGPDDFGADYLYTRWVPRYNNTNTKPKIRYDIWQFSNGKLGKPNTLAGLGHVDLNVFRTGFTVKNLIMTAAKPAVKPPTTPVKPPVKPPVVVTPPKPPMVAPPKPPAAKKKRRLTIAHFSGQFSDTNTQHTADLIKLFAKGYDVIGGTEAGPGAGNMTSELRRLAAKYKYFLSENPRYDTWVLVKQSLLTGATTKGAEFALWRESKTPGSHPGNWGDKGIVWASFTLNGFGKVTIGVVHYLTVGGAGAAAKTKYDKVYATEIKKFGAAHSTGTDLVFVTGDFNLVDKTHDVFYGIAPFVTCWDELKKWPNTGHSNIDAVARYKANKRVKVISATVLDDGDMMLNTDHYLVVTVYEITQA